MRSGERSAIPATTEQRGFTIVELIVVMAILGLLVSMVAPRYFQHVDRAREAALRQNLYVTRDAIDKYHADTGKYPASLQALVDARYIRTLPEDPMTGRSDTWVLIAPADASKGAVFDLRSGAKGRSLEGQDYASL